MLTCTTDLLVTRCLKFTYGKVGTEVGTLRHLGSLLGSAEG